METLFNNQRTIILILVGITFLYFLPGVISPRDFWVEDEARYAEILREVFSDGHFLVMHLNGHPYPDKPPFYFWLAALVSSVFGGVSVFNYMVVTWLTTLGAVISTYLLGNKLFGSKEALMGTLILMSSLLFLAGAGIVRMDMMLTFFVTLSLYFFWRAFQGDGRRFYSYFWLATGFSVLTKGPLGLSFPVLTAIIFIIYQRKFKEIKPLFFNIGFLLFFPLGIGWLVAAWFAGYQEFVNNIIFQQVLERATDSFIHKQPFYFYIMLLPVLFLPWSAYLPRAIYKLFHSPVKSEFAYLFIWFISSLLLISVISGKLFIYLLPVFPPLALMLGKHLSTILIKEEPDKSFLIESAINIVLIFGTFLISPFVIPQFIDASGLPLTFLAISSLLFLVFGGYYIFKNYRIMIFILLFLGMAFYNAYIFLALAPRLDSFLSSRAMSEEISAYMEQGYTVGIHGGRRGLFSFYANAKIPEVSADNLQGFLERSSQHMLVLKAEDIKRFQKNNELSVDLNTVYSRNVANITYNMVKLNE